MYHEGQNKPRAAGFIFPSCSSQKQREEQAMRRSMMYLGSTAISVLLLAGSMAAQHTTTPGDRKHDRRDIHRDTRDIHRDKRDLRNDKKDLATDRERLAQDKQAGNVAGARATRADMRQDSHDIHRDTRDLRNDQRDRRQDVRDLKQDKQQ